MIPDLDETVPHARAAGSPPAAEPPHELADDFDDTVVVARRPATPRPVLPEPEVAVAPVRGHHRIRIPSGVLLELDVPLYLGRRPRVPRVQPGPAPRLVTLPSPRGELSATHLELRESGRAVVARDLRSTNGSVVHVPGASARVLIGGESAVVSPGTLIDLGDGNLIEVLRPALVPEVDS